VVPRKGVSETIVNTWDMFTDESEIERAQMCFTLGRGSEEGALHPNLYSGGCLKRAPLPYHSRPD